MVDVIYLKEAKVFDSVEAEMLEQMALFCERREFAAGQVLFRTGDAAEELFILMRGRAALTIPISVFMVDRELQIDSKGPGEHLGWSSLVEPHIYTLTATGIEAGEALVISREALLGFCQEHPATGFAIMRNVACSIGERLVEVKTLLIKEVERSIRLV